MAAIAAESPNAGPRQSRRFLALYALAAAGGAVAYVPFLTILLPVQVQALAPALCLCVSTLHKSTKNTLS